MGGELARKVTVKIRFPQVKRIQYEIIIKENQWMKLPRLQKLKIFYPFSDMKLGLKSLENSFVNFSTFNGRELTLIDAIRVSLGCLN